MKLTDATPIGEETINTLHGSRVEKVYAPWPNGLLLDDLRRALGIPINQAAQALEIGPVDFYALRRGRKIFQADEFALAVRQLVNAYAEANPVDKKIFDIAAHHGFGSDLEDP